MCACRSLLWIRQNKRQQQQQQLLRQRQEIWPRLLEEEILRNGATSMGRLGEASRIACRSLKLIQTNKYRQLRRLSQRWRQQQQQQQQRQQQMIDEFDRHQANAPPSRHKAASLILSIRMLPGFPKPPGELISIVLFKKHSEFPPTQTAHNLILLLKKVGADALNSPHFPSTDR